MVKTKRFLAFFLALFLIFTVRFKSGYGQVDAATAGWKHNATGWWYCYQDGSYPASKWASIGGKCIILIPRVIWRPAGSRLVENGII